MYAALEFVGLTDVAHKTVRTLGAKERRFIEVARAVVGQPKLILLDEPAAGLPDEETALLGQIIRSIPDRVGATVILVDHDMEPRSGLLRLDGGARLRSAAGIRARPPRCFAIPT